MKAELKDLELELWLRRRAKKEIVWTTKDGKEIPIDEMSTSHLINAINYIKFNDRLNEIYCDFDAENFGDR